MDVDLDNLDLAELDPENIAGQLASFPLDCKTAWQEAQAIDLPKDYSSLKKFVLLGMGGSGAANEAIKEILFTTDLIIETVHDYTLPGFTDSETIVIASSYSGNTEELLDAFGQAVKKGTKSIAITTGGKLKEMVVELNTPSFFFNYPSQPRMATPYLFTSLLAIFTSLGHLKLQTDYLETCNLVADTIKTFLPDNPLATNPAKKLAQRLYGKIPVIYSSTLLRGMAMRFKNQINENAKSFASYDYFPELDHNTIEGYAVSSDDIFIVNLKSNFEHNRLPLRQSITSEIMQNNNIAYQDINFSMANDIISEHLIITSFSDAVSFYLAMMNRINPTTISNIRYLKSKL